MRRRKSGPGKRKLLSTNIWKVSSVKIVALTSDSNLSFMIKLGRKTFVVNDCVHRLGYLCPLQTTVGEVSSVNQPHTGLTMRILFDSGSQRSYITERTRNKLSLSAIRGEKLLFKTFGCENEQPKLYKDKQTTKLRIHCLIYTGPSLISD